MTSAPPTAIAPLGPTRSGERSKVRAFGGYQPGLDGMRGVGIITVLLYHANTSWLVGSFVNVSQFFTVSGFLITAILLHEQSGRGIDLRRYWIRRFRRLLPGALLALVVVALFGAFAADRQQADGLTGEVFAAATYWVNWKFILENTGYVDQFSSPSPVQHYWSLAIEEQFYILLPLMMLLVHRLRGSMRALAILIGAAALASAAWTIHLQREGAAFDRIYFGTDTRLVEILVGSLLAILLTRTGIEFSERARRVLAVVGVVVFAGSVAVWLTVPIGSPKFWGGGQLPFAISSAVLIVVVLADRGPIPWLYKRSPLPLLGRLTYGIYLYHWPIYLWLTPNRTGLDTIPLLIVRVAVTLTVAGLSFRFIEEPIRKYGLPAWFGRWRIAAAPIAMVLVVGLTALAVNRDAPDPLATLRHDSVDSPIQPADGVLDVLLLVDDRDDPVVERVREIDDANDDIRVHVGDFPCRAVDAGATGPSCETWADGWPDLIDDLDPDTVVVYTEGWTDADLDALTGDPDADADVAHELLDDGADLLTSAGARVVVASPGIDFGAQIRRSSEPFQVAAIRLANERLDVRRVVQMPDPLDGTEEEWIDESAKTLLTNASLYQRVDRSEGERVLVLGDSQARSLGYGLERWGGSTGTATVWNAATEGCGFFVDGVTVDDRGTETEPSPQCTDAVRHWSEQVEQFDPDVVVVLTSLWDLQPRRLDAWPEALRPGDPTFDEALVDTYEEAAGVFTSTGARVVWVQPPCIGRMDEFGTLEPDAQHDADLSHLRDDILPRLAEDEPDVDLYDLDAVLCPDGRFQASLGGVDQVRSDGVHFSVDGSMWFAEEHGEELLGG